MPPVSPSYILLPVTLGTAPSWKVFRNLAYFSQFHLNFNARTFVAENFTIVKVWHATPSEQNSHVSIWVHFTASKNRLCFSCTREARRAAIWNFHWINVTPALVAKNQAIVTAVDYFTIDFCSFRKATFDFRIREKCYWESFLVIFLRFSITICPWCDIDCRAVSVWKSNQIIDNPAWSQTFRAKCYWESFLAIFHRFSIAFYPWSEFDCRAMNIWKKPKFLVENFPKWGSARSPHTWTQYPIGAFDVEKRQLLKVGSDCAIWTRQKYRSLSKSATWDSDSCDSSIERLRMFKLAASKVIIDREEVMLSGIRVLIFTRLEISPTGPNAQPIRVPRRRTVIGSSSWWSPSWSRIRSDSEPSLSAKQAILGSVFR